MFQEALKECEVSNQESINKIKALETNLDENTKTTAATKKELETTAASLSQGITNSFLLNRYSAFLVRKISHEKYLMKKEKSIFWHELQGLHLEGVHPSPLMGLNSLKRL